MPSMASSKAAAPKESSTRVSKRSGASESVNCAPSVLTRAMVTSGS